VAVNKKTLLNEFEILKNINNLVGGSKNSILSNTILADNKEPSLDEMPSDEDTKRAMEGNSDSNENSNNQQEQVESNENPSSDSNEDLEKLFAEDGADNQDNIENTETGDNPLETEETPELAPEENDVTIGPYDLAFNIRRIITAFTQVVNEATQLKKLTENISSNMTAEDQAAWIEQRRFFIETSKEAETKWGEFKQVLLKFSITPKF
jgi:hypothetical protein